MQEPHNPPQPQYQIAAFYHFAAIEAEEVAARAAAIEALGDRHGLKGLIILASEGINGTISGVSQDAVIGYLNDVSEYLGFPQFTPKWSVAPVWPFRKFKVRIRKEIVTLGQPEVQPLPPKSPRHLAPNEWNRVIEEEDALVLDTRNWYETRIGKFKTAIDPDLHEFQEFGAYLERAQLPKEKKILIYCTGGIRCEKAIVEMENKGFHNVFQLDGGILNYLAQYPDREFAGECFVFDQRVAVDQNLQPTAIYKMCPHCGQPADQLIQCARCETEAFLCPVCASGGPNQSEAHLKTCSKNCAHHAQLKPGKKGRNQLQGYRFQAQRARRLVGLK